MNLEFDGKIAVVTGASSGTEQRIHVDGGLQYAI